MDLTDESDAAVVLVKDAMLALQPLGLGDRQDVAAAATAAVLRSLSDLMDDEDADEDWPDSWALSKLADDIEGGGE
jgi:hypothetical protein